MSLPKKAGVSFLAVSALFAFASSAFAQGPAAGAPGGAAAHPCEQIVQACESAGFVKGGYKQGKGLWRDCVDPVTQGKAAPQGGMALPTVDPNTVAACKAKHSKFGEGKVGR